MVTAPKTYQHGRKISKTGTVAKAVFTYNADTKHISFKRAWTVASLTHNNHSIAGPTADEKIHQCQTKSATGKTATHHLEFGFLDIIMPNPASTMQNRDGLWALHVVVLAFPHRRDRSLEILGQAKSQDIVMET